LAPARLGCTGSAALSAGWMWRRKDGEGMGRSFRVSIVVGPDWNCTLPTSVDQLGGRLWVSTGGRVHPFPLCRPGRFPAGVALVKYLRVKARQQPP
jgi:hypothetical protein